MLQIFQNAKCTKRQSACNIPSYSKVLFFFQFFSYFCFGVAAMFSVHFVAPGSDGTAQILLFDAKAAKHTEA